MQPPEEIKNGPLYLLIVGYLGSRIEGSRTGKSTRLRKWEIQLCKREQGVCTCQGEEMEDMSEGMVLTPSLMLHPITFLPLNICLGGGAMTLPLLKKFQERKKGGKGRRGSWMEL